MGDSTTHANGRQYQDERGAYVLPNDAQEHDRLDTQSKALITLMKGKPFHAPVENPKRILDIGCGTGSMTYLLARRFPDAEVIGVDVSPVPERHAQPENLTYIQGNIFDLVKGDSRFAPGSFDYIFHRLLVLGITDWPGYFTTVRSLVRSGGWAEMQDFDMMIFDRADKELIGNGQFRLDFVEDCEAIGLDVHIGRKLADYMRGLGSFDRVNELMYKMPILPDPDMPGAEFMTNGNMKPMAAFNYALLKRVSGERRSAEEIEKINAEMVKEYANLKVGDHVRMFVAVGQKSS